MSEQMQERGKALENEYFRRKEKELIAKMKAKLDAENFTDLQLQCPKCDGSLVETKQENIVIDVCNKCSGVWLDAGEFAQAIEKNENSGWLSRFFS